MSKGCITSYSTPLMEFHITRDTFEREGSEGRVADPVGESV